MEKNKKEIENEDEIDVRKIYLRNFKPHQPRVGKEYQAIIPDCISAPKKKENNEINDKKNLSNIPDKNKTNIDNKNKKDDTKKNFNKNDDIKIKNDIIGHKTLLDKTEDEKEEYEPIKKKKINNDI